MSVTTQALIWCAIQLAVVCGLAILLARIAGRKNPSAGVWCLRTGIVLTLLVTALAPFSLPSWFSLMPEAGTDVTANVVNVVEVDGPRSSADTNGDKPAVSLAPSSETATLWEDFKATLMTAPAEPAPSVEVDPAKPIVQQTTSSRVIPYVVAGVGMGVLWFLVGLISVRRLLKHTQPVTDSRATELLDVVVAELSYKQKVRLIESEQISTAATVGFFRPVVLLPATWYDWSEDELHAVLAHEVSHVQANDFAATVLSQLVVAVHFLHPFVHYLSQQLRMFQELAADASASGLVGGRTNYATVLAGMALRTDSQTNLWATQAFLPAPRTMLRRIEMLRDVNTIRTGVSRPARVLLTSAMVLTMCGVVGLRANPPQQEDKVPVSTIATKTTRAASQSEPLSLDWVPNGSLAVVAMKPQALLNHEIGKPFAELMERELKSQVNLKAVDSVTMCRVHPSILDSDQVVDHRQAFGVLSIFTSKDGTAWKDQSLSKETSYTPDKSTLIISHSSAALAHIRKAGKNATTNKFWLKQWDQVKTKSAAIIVDVGSFRDVTEPKAMLPPTFAFAAPIWQEGEILTVGLETNGDPRLSARLTTTSEKVAKDVSKTVEAALVLARNLLMEQQRQMARSPDTTVASLADALASVSNSLENAKTQQDGKDSVIEMSFSSKVLAAVAARIGPTMIARQRTATQMNKLKYIALSMHNYHSTFDTFPPAYSMGKDGRGKHPVSWRVLLTPYLERQDIYDNYHFDEPWDSEHNQKATADMPAVFGNGNPGLARNHTAFFAVLSTDERKPTGFGRHRGMRIRDFTDGTSHSLLIVEANRKVHWAKPDDIEWDPATDLPDLGFADTNFLAARADGSVARFSSTRNKAMLKLMLTINDGRPVDQSEVRAP